MGEVSDGLQAILVAIESQQRSIERLIETLAAAGPDKTGSTAPDLDTKEEPKLVNWLAVAGDERRAAWEGLASFVETIVRRYDLQLTIRPCWWQHTEAIEELTALWHFHQLSYADPTKLGSAMSWRDTFHRSRDRLKDLFASCRDIHVDARITAAWMRDDVRQQFRQAVESDVSGPPSRPGS